MDCCLSLAALAVRSRVNFPAFPLAMPANPRDALDGVGADWTLRHLGGLAEQVTLLDCDHAIVCDALAAIRLAFWEAYFAQTGALTGRDRAAFADAQRDLAAGADAAGQHAVDAAAAMGRRFGSPISVFS